MQHSRRRIAQLKRSAKEEARVSYMATFRFIASAAAVARFLFLFLFFFWLIFAHLIFRNSLFVATTREKEETGIMQRRSARRSRRD